MICKWPNGITRETHNYWSGICQDCGMAEPEPSRFLERLAAFEKAAAELLETWEKEDHTGDYFSAGYPFAKSFDEVLHDIINWRDVQSRADEK